MEVDTVKLVVRSFLSNSLMWMMRRRKPICQMFVTTRNCGGERERHGTFHLKFIFLSDIVIAS